jgi:hypothetical protein
MLCSSKITYVNYLYFYINVFLFVLWWHNRQTKTLNTVVTFTILTALDVFPDANYSTNVLKLRYILDQTYFINKLFIS